MKCRDLRTERTNGELSPSARKYFVLGGPMYDIYVDSLEAAVGIQEVVDDITAHFIGVVGAYSLPAGMKGETTISDGKEIAARLQINRPWLRSLLKWIPPCEPSLLERHLGYVCFPEIALSLVHTEIASSDITVHYDHFPNFLKTFRISAFGITASRLVVETAKGLSKNYSVQESLNSHPEYGVISCGYVLKVKGGK